MVRSLARSSWVSQDWGDYESERMRLGYALTHRTQSGWVVRQNARVQKLTATGHGVFFTTLASDQRTQGRQARLQDNDNFAVAIDTQAERAFQVAGARHTITVGFDRIHYHGFQMLVG